MRSRLLIALLLAGGAHGGEGPHGQVAEDWTIPHMDEQRYGMLLVDRLEYGDGDEGDTLLWDVQAWYGGDYNKIWLETEGEARTGHSPEVSELQALYDRTFTPFWSWQAGVRYDIRPHGAADTAYAVVGLQGLAPQWFESDVALFLSEDGDLGLRGEVEYDLRVTQRLILQPRLELEANADDVPELGIGSGLSETGLGLRLRYEIKREVAPYIGVRWERLHGDTRDMARSAGEPASGTAFVIGIRAWY